MCQNKCVSVKTGSLKVSIFVAPAEQSNDWGTEYINFHNLVVPKEQPLPQPIYNGHYCEIKDPEASLCLQSCGSFSVDAIETGK